ncbi:MAG: hypothetical protein QN178_16920 [Armatimonadota bacterium]|nr:hypothetical protein [Armatimonadota bacterium]
MLASALAMLCLAAVLAPVTASAQPLTVDVLLQRIFTEPNPQPYTMTADFAAEFLINLPSGRFTVRAAGTIVESRTAPGEPRRRKATVTRLEVPLLLRPFNNSIRKVVTDLIEAEQKPNEILPVQDIFIAEERPPNRYLLGGVRTDIVVETMRKYNQGAYVDDITSRRAIAKWLWSPTQRGSIVRPGPGPYMLAALVDDTGLLHQLTLYYDWGQVGNSIRFVTVGGRPFWREVVSDTASEVPGLGRVDGKMVLQVQNHCLNCPPR